MASSIVSRIPVKAGIKGAMRSRTALPRSLRTIRAILRREFIDVLRDRRSLALTLLWPISMLVMYGYGIRYDVDNVPITVLDHSETTESRDLAEQMLRSKYFSVVRFARDEREVEHDLMNDAIRAAIVIPRDFADKLRNDESTAVQVLIDGSDSNTATIAQGYALAIVNQFVATRRASLNSLANAPPPIQVASRIWYNPELRSVNFIVPGVIAVIMMIVGAILTALSIVKEKERGTIEQILVSPIRPLEMMIGKLVPYLAIALIDLLIIIIAGYLLFSVPIKGSFIQLAIFALLYIFCALGVGVFVSTIADSMQNAMLAAIFMSLLPSVLLSGFVFPLEDLPPPIRAISYFFPARYFVTAIRGIYLKRVGIEVLWPEAILLVIFAVTIVGFSAARFQDRLE
jgi:ABC-2 type transport system permease protein